MKNRNFYLLIFFIGLIAVSCGSRKKNLGPTALDKEVQKLTNEKSFSIILYDMQLDEDKDQYQHKYRIKTNIEDSLPAPTVTDWQNVDDAFFAENLDNMGLEVAAKDPSTGKVTKIPSPPGFNNVVGNERYGEWRRDSNGNSFWAFYGQYMFMSSMFNMAFGRPIYRSTYTDYGRYRNNPSTRNRPYYGTGTNRYGTNSPSTRASNPSFFQRKQQQQRFNSFRQKVNSNPSRYTRSSSSSRTSRSSSSRGRGGGFGK